MAKILDFMVRTPAYSDRSKSFFLMRHRQRLVRDKAKEILEWLDANPVGAKKQSQPAKNTSSPYVGPAGASPMPLHGGPSPVPIHNQPQPVPVQYAPQPVPVHQPQLHPQAYGGGYPVEVKSLPPQPMVQVESHHFLFHDPGSCSSTSIICLFVGACIALMHLFCFSSWRQTND